MNQALARDEEVQLCITRARTACVVEKPGKVGGPSRSPGIRAAAASS